MAFRSIIGAVRTSITIFSFNASSALVGRLPAAPGGSDYQACYDDQLVTSYG